MVTELQPGDPPLIGPYRFVARLGRGGMGQMFLGLTNDGQPVAVKVHKRIFNMLKVHACILNRHG